MNNSKDDGQQVPEIQKQDAEKPPKETAPAPQLEAASQGEKLVTINVVEYEELKTLAKERDDYLHRLQRAVADYYNLSRRTEKMRETVQTDAIKRVVRTMLPLADDIVQALAAAEKTQGAGPMIEGLRMIEKKFYDTLAGFGIRPIETVGTPFSPHVHEAIFQEPAVGVAPHTVVRELRKGFQLGEDVIRPAQVSVAAPPADEDDAAPEEAEEGQANP